jgi:hypothetical protein
MKHFSDLELTELLSVLGVPEEMLERLVVLYQHKSSFGFAEPIMDRVHAASVARDLFVRSGVTRSISEAFELFQKHIALKERPIRITRTNEASRSSLISSAKRRICEACGTKMQLRLINTPRGKQNVMGWKSCWICPQCLNEVYSKKNLKEWLLQLRKENVNGLRRVRRVSTEGGELQLTGGVHGSGEG